MLRICIALPHCRTTSSCGGAKTRRPVPIPSRVTERAMMRHPKQPYAEGELARRLDPLYKRCVPSGNGDEYSLPPPF